MVRLFYFVSYYMPVFMAVDWFRLLFIGPHLPRPYPRVVAPFITNKVQFARCGNTQHPMGPVPNGGWYFCWGRGYYRVVFYRPLYYSSR